LSLGDNEIGFLHLNRCIARFLRKTDYAAAMADCERALALDAPSSATSQRAFEYRAMLRSQLGDDSAALNDMSTAIKARRASVIAFAFRGLAYEAKGDKIAAVGDYTYAIWAPALNDFEQRLQGIAKRHLDLLFDKASARVATPKDDQLSSFTVGTPTPSVRGQTIVVLRLSDNGGFFVPVTINGKITLDFLLDTAASDVSIPAEVALTLAHSHTITQADLLGTEHYRLADGSSVDGETVRIHTLQVGDRIVENVTASVSKTGSDLLLGQSFQHFKSWSLSNERRQLILE
jgi:clan AA aspartic protease (TIGR02281 family)